MENINWIGLEHFGLNRLYQVVNLQETAPAPPDRQLRPDRPLRNSRERQCLPRFLLITVDLLLNVKGLLAFAR